MQCVRKIHVTSDIGKMDDSKVTDHFALVVLIVGVSEGQSKKKINNFFLWKFMLAA